MSDDREKLIALFLNRVEKYKDAMRYQKSGYGGIKRVLRNFNQFGLPYAWYQISRIPTLRHFVRIPSTFFFGKKIVLPAGDVGSGVYSLHGILPHKDERKLTLWMLKHLKDDAVLYDIGAHMGYYTALAEKLLAHGEAHAFEANKNLCKYLHWNFSNATTVHIACMAVADRIGEVDFYDVSDVEDSSTSSRFPLTEHPVAPSKVNATTIDTYVHAGHKPPTVLKLDIEGGEYDAIRGAADTIQRNKPVILMEIWGGAQGRKYSDPAVKKLQELGYQAFLIGSDGSAST